MDVALTAYQARLAGDPTLASLISTFMSAPSVFIHSVPEGAALPLICITGPASDTPFDDKTSQGRELLLDFRVTTSKTGSTVIVDTIAERMRSLIHRSPVSVVGYTSLYEEAFGPILDDIDDAYSRIVTLRLVLGGAA